MLCKYMVLSYIQLDMYIETDTVQSPWPAYSIIHTHIHSLHMQMPALFCCLSIDLPLVIYGRT